MESAKYLKCPKCDGNVRYDTSIASIGGDDCVKCVFYEHMIRCYCPHCDFFINNEIEKMNIIDK